MQGLGTFLAIIGEGSCCWKWSGFRSGNSWSSPNAIFLTPAERRTSVVLPARMGEKILHRYFEGCVGTNLFLSFKLMFSSLKYV